MSEQDSLYIPKLQLSNGEILEEGWHDVNVSDIGAVYKVTEEGINVSDNGNLTGYGDLDMLSEAPEHYDIKTGSFSGDIILENGITLTFKNNKIDNATRI